MDLSKIESDFKTAMLPEFPESLLEFQFNNLYFRVVKFDLVAEIHLDIYQFEIDIKELTQETFFSNMKKTFQYEFLKALNIDLTNLSENYLNYVDDCKRKEVVIIKSMLEFALEQYQPKIHNPQH